MGYWKWQFDRNKDILIFLMWFITSVEIIGFIMFMGFILGGQVGMNISLGMMLAVFIIGWVISAIIKVSKQSYSKYLNSKNYPSRK